MIGYKEHDGKIHVEYDWDFLQAQMQRMGKNKAKYAKYNWQNKLDVELLKDSLFRHVLEVMKGNYADDGDEYGHLAAIALNAGFIQYQLNKHNELKIPN